MEFKELFFDNLGNFQWSSITVGVSILVLVAQVFQFFIQQRMLKKNKKIEMLIRFRMDSLQEVKNSVGMLSKVIEPGVKKIDKTLLNEANNNISINLNSSNEKSMDLSNKIIALLLLTRKIKDNEEVDKALKQLPPEEWAFVLGKLIDSYQSYENAEIEKIAKYK